MASFDYIRRYYGVPTKRGGRVRIWTGEEGTIIWTHNAYLKIRLDGGHTGHYHPRYGIFYFDGGVQT